MTNKKNIIGFLIFLIIVSVGFIKINIINTKALSPIGNGEDNYELVKEEFGEDFEEFIKDKSEVKIYTVNEINENVTIKVLDKEYILKTNNILTRSFYNLGEGIYNNLTKLVNNIKGINFKTNKESKEVNSDNQGLDEIIDDFLENRK